MGRKATYKTLGGLSRFGSKADMCSTQADVRKCQ